MVLLPLLLVGLTLLGIHLSQVEVVRARRAGPRAAGRPARAGFPVPAARWDRCVLDSSSSWSRTTPRTSCASRKTFAANKPMLIHTLAPVLVCQLSGLALSGAYRGVWRYTRPATCCDSVAGSRWAPWPASSTSCSRRGSPGCPRAVFVLDWLLLAVLVGASRVSFRLLGEALRTPARRGPAGARLRCGGRRGAGAAGAPQQRRPSRGRPSDSSTTTGRRWARASTACPCSGPLDELEALLRAYPGQEVVVASRKIPTERLRRLEATCAAHGVAVLRASVRLE